MAAVRVKLPRILALEVIGGLIAKAEWSCGCTTAQVTLPEPPSVWVYLERCSLHDRRGPG
jgi:hypothetical protein